MMKDTGVSITAQKMKFSIKDFSSKCDQIRRKPRIWSHLLEKSLMENFIFVQSSELVSLANYIPFAATLFNWTKQLYWPEKLMGSISKDHLETQKLKCFKYFSRHRSRYIVTRGTVSWENYENSRSSTAVIKYWAFIDCR